MRTYNKIAAKWWSEKLRNVNLSNFNNGDESNAGAMAMLLAGMNAMKSQSPVEAIDKFEEILAEKIKDAVEASCFGSITFGVDYHPDAILAEAAREAGVDADALPWKTTMEVKCSKVSVSAGYAAPWEVIFPTYK